MEFNLEKEYIPESSRRYVRLGPGLHNLTDWELYGKQLIFWTQYKGFELCTLAVMDDQTQINIDKILQYDYSDLQNALMFIHSSLFITYDLVMSEDYKKKVVLTHCMELFDLDIVDGCVTQEHILRVFCKELSMKTGISPIFFASYVYKKWENCTIWNVLYDMIWWFRV